MEHSRTTELHGEGEGAFVSPPLPHSCSLLQRQCGGIRKCCNVICNIATVFGEETLSISRGAVLRALMLMK